MDFDLGFDGGGGGDFDTGGGGLDLGGGGDAGGGMVVDPTTGDVYDEGGNFVGNIDDPTFGGPGLGSTYGGGSKFSDSLGGLGKLFSNSKGDLNLPLLLSLLGAGGGALMNYNATNKATGQMTDAVNKANDTITQLLGGSAKAFQPFTDLGPIGAERLKNLPESNLAQQFSGGLAGNFGPLGKGKGIGAGPTSFAALMNKGR